MPNVYSAHCGVDVDCGVRGLVVGGIMTTQISDLIARDFHTLSSEEVERLLAEADSVKYRKPKNANGSRARYFHAKLQREKLRESR